MPHKRRKAASAMKRMRVQLSPATDRWMMGDRYGEIMSMPKTGKHAGKLRIKLDKSGRSLWFLPKDIGEIF